MSVVKTILEGIAQRDERVMSRVVRWHPPRWVRVWMLSSTRAGDGWLWAGLAPLILLSGDEHRFQVMAAVSVAVTVGIATYSALKRIAVRQRPTSHEKIDWVKLIPPDRFSFPSGHSLTAFAVTTPIWMFYPTYWMELMFCAASVAISRVVLGMHFVTDVVVGSILGFGIGYAAYSMFA